MRKKHLFSLLVAGLIFNGLQAQKDFLPGRLFLSGGDTVNGLVRYKNWGNSPIRISFRRSAGAATETYTLSQLKGFDVENADKYRKAVIWKDVYSSLRAMRYEAPARRRDTVFLRAVVEGSGLSLYEYTQKKKIHFFIRPAGDTLQELLYTMVEDAATGRSLWRAIFRDQLKKYAFGHADQPALFRKIENADYTEEVLKKIVLQINGPEASLYAVPGKGVRTRQFFVAGGMALYHVKDDIQFEPLSAYTYKGGLVSGGMDLFTLRRFQHLIFRSELRLGNSGYKGYYEKERFGEKEHTQLQWEQFFINPAFNILHSFGRTEKSRFFAGADIGFYLAYTANYSGTTTNLATGDTKKSTYEPDMWETNSRMIIHLDLGFMYNNRVELRAYRNLGGLLWPRKNSQLTGLLVGYRF